MEQSKEGWGIIAILVLIGVSLLLLDDLIMPMFIGQPLDEIDGLTKIDGVYVDQDCQPPNNYTYTYSLVCTVNGKGESIKVCDDRKIINWPEKIMQNCMIAINPGE